jgi:hypothetical protein
MFPNIKSNSTVQCSVEQASQTEFFDMGLEKIVQFYVGEPYENGMSNIELENPVQCHVRQPYFFHAY